MNIKNNIINLRQSLPPTCLLVAVSKTQPPEKIKEAYAAGQRAFGENKAQEMLQKYEAMPNDINWHMIGHLQSNKVKYIVPFVYLIHSVDSFKLLEEINKQGKKINRIIPCLLQIHIAEEDTKFGFSPAEVEKLFQDDSLRELHHVKITGLMGMATFSQDKERVRKEFRGLKQLFEKLKTFDLPNHVEMKELSMGMSGDYEIAIQEGSTMVRVGSAIFGERVYP